MKLTLIKKRDPSERDGMVVMVAIGDDTPTGGRKVIFSVNINETVDMQDIVDEQKLNISAEELGYAVLGDKRFKGLFRMEQEKPVLAKVKAKSDGHDDDDLKPNAKKAPAKKTAHTPKNKSVTAGSYDNKSVGAG